jgi:hypothetical protein
MEGKGFQKGNKLGEKSKRGPAKLASEFKERLRLFFENKFEEFQDEEAWNKLPVKDKLNFLSNLLPYIQPKMAPTDIYGLSRLSIEDLEIIIDKLKADRNEKDQD